MARWMKTKRQIVAERTRMQEMLDGRYARYWSDSDLLALRVAIEALEWVLEPWPGTKRMKTRARIEDMVATTRKVLTTEKDELLRRGQCFSMQALGWILEQRNLPVTVCFTWATVEGGPRKFGPLNPRAG